MKELIAKEFIFLFVGIMVAIPVGIVFISLIDLTPEVKLTKDKSVMEMDLMLIGCIIGFVGVYITRLAVWAVKNLLLVK